jgi:1-deoxyxylulose-5-phosphate synthase
MEYVRLGKSGLKVSRLCIGCMSFGGARSGYFEWTLGYEKAAPIIKKAIDLGINFFDTADMYSDGKSEEVLGKAVKGVRNDLVIATKVYNPMGTGPNDRGLSRKHIRDGIRRSLERLGMDHVDLYQIHRWDYESPIEETLTTLDGIVKDGRTTYIGASSMWAWQFAEALGVSERLGLERFISMQNHYNLVYREEEREMIPLCVSEGVGLIPWSPLARGFLSGKYKRDKKAGGRRYKSDHLLKQRFFKPSDFDVLDRVVEMANAKGVTPAQLSLAWILHKPGVSSPIVGLSSVKQLEELVAALEIKLTQDEIKRLEEPYKPRWIEGHV